MHSVHETERWHPVWCDRKHDDASPVHGAAVGVDLELSGGLAYGVALQHVEDPDGGEAPTEVLLLERKPGQASSTRFSLAEAGILRGLLDEALQLVG